MTWLRIILLFFDSAFLGLIFFNIIDNPPSMEEAIWLALGCVFLILHITYICFSRVSKDKEPWLITLYFRRKALEEKKRVQALQKELDQKEL
jgi:hypothetical protein